MKPRPVPPLPSCRNPDRCTRIGCTNKLPQLFDNHLGVDVSSGDDDQVLEAALHIEETFCIDTAQVSGAEELSGGPWRRVTPDHGHSSTR